MAASAMDRLESHDVVHDHLVDVVEVGLQSLEEPNDAARLDQNVENQDGVNFVVLLCDHTNQVGSDDQDGEQK